MTAYIDCKECGASVPWYYAFEFKHVPHNDAMHPYCARDRIDEEGCGAVWLALALAHLDDIAPENAPHGAIIQKVDTWPT